MASLVDEQQTWWDASTNTPIVGGNIYVGERGADPRVAKAIFSDRELTTPLANPQSTDSAGRSVNKIWTEGRYSIEVSNSDDVQKYIELDNGEGAGAGVIALGDVQGANTITATASTTITAYEDLQQYVFRTAQINTGAVTLNIDSVGAKSVVKNNVEPIQTGNFKAEQNIIVTYNLTNDNFEWADQNLISVASYTGTDIVSAATITIPTDGDYFNVTGTTGISGVSVDNDRSFTLEFAAAALITVGSGITLNNDGNNYTTSAGDIIEFQSTSANTVSGRIIKADGQAVVASAVAFAETFESTLQTITTSGSLTLAHGLSAQPTMYMVYLECISAESGYSIGDEIVISSAQTSAGITASRGVSISPDSTNINVRYASTAAVFEYLNKTTGARVTLVNASWNMIVRAYV